MSSRNIPINLVTHLNQAATTTCALLKVVPRSTAAVFGITTLDADVVYDDGTGPLTYRARRGYTAADVVLNSSLGVDNGEAQGLLAEYPVDGMTLEGVRRGDYDGSRFAQYLVNYTDLSQGHVEINAGTVGQVRQIDDLSVAIELRSLVQQLKQQSVIDLTSISCRARFGDEECKKQFVWADGTVDSVGAENDRTFVSTALPPDFKLPAIVKWVSGLNAGRENEIEDYDAATGVLTLMIPTYQPIAEDDQLSIRRDCDKSKAMCIEYENLNNMRAEPELPRANGTDLQSPTPPKG